MPPRQDKRCSNCLTEHSPGWRRSAVTKQSLCNKCGLHERIHRCPRPVTPQPVSTIVDDLWAKSVPWSGGLNALTGATISDYSGFGPRTCIKES
ncbi:hypothetical protein R3P38DRAFT_1795804 [Favolaschia claudopus]|uniref:GATA-type domain-containing protein n=1 Tax=Favolaschia claudopus TaxID=2862362 RepID=A0AAW0A5G8_9AGAR